MVKEVGTEATKAGAEAVKDAIKGAAESAEKVVKKGIGHFDRHTIKISHSNCGRFNMIARKIRERLNYVL